MRQVKAQTINFIAEQTGNVEHEFKNAIIHMLFQYRKLVRAYLVQVKYKNENKINVALCFRIEESKDNYILHESTKIFQSIFDTDQFLDIVFLDQQQELEIRNIACPFYTSLGYQFPIPDFYLTSKEGYGFDFPISCFKRKRLYGKHPDGYLLCDIKPSLTGQKYGLGEKNIEKIVLAGRFLNSSLFPVKEWPSYVHIAIPLKDLDKIDYVGEPDIKLIGWGEIHNRKKS